MVLPSCVNSAFATPRFERLDLADAAGRVLPEELFSGEPLERPETPGLVVLLRRQEDVDVVVPFQATFPPPPAPRSTRP